MNIDGLEKDWEVVETDNEVHVIPIDDNDEHLFENCPCKPKYKNEEDFERLLVVHNAWDRREAWEKLIHEKI